MVQAIISVIWRSVGLRDSKEIRIRGELRSSSRLVSILSLLISLAAHRIAPTLPLSQPAPVSLTFRPYYFDFIADRAFLHYPSSYSATNALYLLHYPVRLIC